MIGIARNHWFYLILPILLLAAWSLSVSPEAMADPVSLERVYLFDFGIFLPLLYFLYLRPRFSLRASLVRTFALLGSGIWIASVLMPDGAGTVLPWLAWLRVVALPLLIAIELAAFVAIMRHIYGETPDEQTLVDQGMPPIVVKALLAEARFWKRVWSWFVQR